MVRDYPESGKESYLFRLNQELSGQTELEPFFMEDFNEEDAFLGIDENFPEVGDE